MSDDEDEETVDVAYTGDEPPEAEEPSESETEESPESEESQEAEEPQEPDESSGDHPDGAVGPDREGDGESTSPDEILEASADADDPFAELAAQIEEETEFDEDAFAIGDETPGPEGASPFDELDADVDDVDLDELFEEMFVDQGAGELDAGSIWEQLEGTEEDAGTESEVEGDEHVVSAREFCAQCEYAAEPPDVRCTYDGSEIVEFVNKDTVRVRNCPIVARRSQLGEMN